jgi:hypothetical protein
VKTSLPRGTSKKSEVLGTLGRDGAQHDADGARTRAGARQNIPGVVNARTRTAGPVPERVARERDVATTRGRHHPTEVANLYTPAGYQSK